MGRVSACLVVGLGSNPSECHIYDLFRCVFLSLLPWRSDGRSNFDWGLQKINNVDSNNEIQIRKITMLKMESTVDIPKKIYVYIYSPSIIFRIITSKRQLYFILVIKIFPQIKQSAAYNGYPLTLRRKGSTCYLLRKETQEQCMQKSRIS